RSLYVQRLRLGWIKDVIPQEVEERFIDGLPMPPAYLIYLVGDHTNINPFLDGGVGIGRIIRDVIEKNGTKLENFRSILDFGCGCGRIMRQWKDLKGPKIYGTDYNSAPIRWCRKNLPFAEFHTNRLSPPLRYENDSFDFIYAFSVFTHL